MKIEKLSRTASLSKATINTYKKDGLLKSGDDELGALTALSSLMVARFSYEQIKVMHERPDQIQNVIEEHIREMSSGELKYPELCALLGRIDSANVQNIFQLGETIKNAIFLPADKADQAEDIKNKCRALREQLKKVKKDCLNANIFDFFAMIPILGIPFGSARTFFLSRAGDEMKVAYALNDSLSDSLLGLQPNVDIACFERENEYKGTSYDWSRSNLSPGIYISETSNSIDMMGDRAFVINEQLNRLPILSDNF